jgi:hypothetical protein
MAKYYLERKARTQGKSWLLPAIGDGKVLDKTFSTFWLLYLVLPGMGCLPNILPAAMGTTQSVLKVTNHKWLHALQEKLHLKQLPPPASTDNVKELATTNDQTSPTTVTITPTNEDDT